MKKYFMAQLLLRKLGGLTSRAGYFYALPYRPFASHSEIGGVLQTMAGPGSVNLHKDEQTGMATITINNPSKRNAFNGKMMVDLNNCVEELEGWSIGKGVILTGAGRTFCSGGDLETVSKIITDDTLGHYMCTYMQAVTMRLLSLPLVSVAAIDGHALGGGAELSTACDFRLMSATSKIGFVQVRFNILPGWGGGTRLVKIVGQTKALQILSSGRVMSAKAAHDIGLVDAVIHVQKGHSNFVEHAMLWLMENCHGNANATQRIKQLVQGAVELQTQEALDNERKLFCEVWGKEEHRAALNKNTKHNE